VNRERALELSAPLTRASVEYELRMSLSWLSNLRWIAGAAVLAATWITVSILGLGIPAVPLMVIGVGICLYNAGFKWWLSRIQRDSPGISAQPHTLARLQIAADWIAIAALAHFSGGIESPIILYYFFHTTLAALLLSDKDTYISAAGATLLITGTALLEYWSILPHHHVAGLLPVDLYRNPLYLTSTLFFFTSTIFVSAYLATRITRRLRGHEAEMMRLGGNLQRAYRQLEAMYHSAQDVSSTLELQEVLDRLTRSTTKVMSVKGCTIRLLRETGTQLSLASSYGLRDEYLQKGPLLVAQNPLVRQVLAGEIVAVSDIAADDRLQYPVEAAAEGIRATLTAPLQGRTGPLGIIRVYCDSAQCFTEDDDHFLSAVAVHGSIAIENAMAFQAIQNLEESKRKFVLLVTHELRSPIGVVRSLLNAIAGGYAGDLSDLQQDMMGRAVRRTEFLQTLIDDLLNLAAGKTGLRITKKTETVDLQVVLARIVERYRVPAVEKGIDLQVQVSDDYPIHIAATSGELDRAINNLVSNAVKYTLKGGVIEITLEAQPDTAQLVIRDSGIGIPEEALPHLFEEFYRAPNAKAQVKQGTGLGLVITRDIVTRYGGTIRVSSTEAEGTIFTVILPTVATSADQATSDVTADTPQDTRVADSGTSLLNSQMEEPNGDEEDPDC